MSLLRLARKYYRLLLALCGVAFIVGGTIFAIRWAKGYRPGLGKRGPVLTGTGLLVATSDPKGAAVFLNGRLASATDDTLNLPPGNYEVEIKKDGYIPWKKQLQIVAELVTQTTTKLFPSVPNLVPLTYTGAVEPVPSPDGQKIVYKVNQAATDASRGLWVLDLTDRSLAMARPSQSRQVARQSDQYNFLEAKLVWTPDSSQVLAYWVEEKKGNTSSTGSTWQQSNAAPGQPARVTCVTCDISVVTSAILLGTAGLNDPADLRDVTSRLPVLLAQWYQELDLKDKDRYQLLPPFMQGVATASATNLFFSPNEEKLLFASEDEFTIPAGLIPDLPSESTQPEDRAIKPDVIYIYDIKEDRNYQVGKIAAERPGVPTSQTPGNDNSLSSAGASAQNTPAYWPDRLAAPATMMIKPDTDNQPVTPLPPLPSELLTTGLAALKSRYTPMWQLTVQWFPTSGHLLKTNESTISIVEADGTNDATIYNGPFADRFAYPWPDGSRLVMMTSLNQDSPTNLYAINLK